MICFHSFFFLDKAFKKNWIPIFYFFNPQVCYSFFNFVFFSRMAFAFFPPARKDWSKSLPDAHRRFVIECEKLLKKGKPLLVGLSNTKNSLFIGPSSGWKYRFYITSIEKSGNQFLPILRQEGCSKIRADDYRGFKILLEALYEYVTKSSEKQQNWPYTEEQMKTESTASQLFEIYNPLCYEKGGQADLIEVMKRKSFTQPINYCRFSAATFLFVFGNYIKTL